MKQLGGNVFASQPAGRARPTGAAGTAPAGAPAAEGNE